MNLLKDGPLSIINQNIKKRKNESNNNISNKKVIKLIIYTMRYKLLLTLLLYKNIKKKIINSINDVEPIPLSEIKILYGQSSEYLNSCINKYR